MKKRRKPLILLGFPAEFLAFPRWFEHPTYRLGGGRSIQLSYGNIFKIYSILVLNLLNVNRLCPKGGRYNIFLGGVYYIHLTKGANCHVLILQYGSNFVNKKGRPLSALRWLFFFGVLVIVEEIIPVYCIQLFLILFGESRSLWELFKFLSSGQLYLLL